MSRVYSMMTGTDSPRAIVEAASEAEPFVVEAVETPFIEIGGPTGPIFSHALTKPAAEPKIEQQREFPRIVPPAPPSAVLPATILSVRLHDVQTRLPGRADGADTGLVALHFPDHPVSGEYRTLRDEIARQIPKSTSRTLCFTAAASEAGTTTVLLNLGITLARDGQRVLVVDANFARPSVASMLSLSASPGLAEVLDGGVPLAWALQPTAVSSLQALTAGADTAQENGVSLAKRYAQAMPKLVGQLRQWFEWILIDAGVWGVSPERDAVCNAANAVYLVSREADADRPEFTGLRTRVRQLGGALRGYITTRA